MKDKYQAHFFYFTMRFVIVPISYQQNNFQISDVYILVKCGRQIRLRHPRGGPDTHDDPHETGAARTAARPLFVQKNHFRNYQKSLNVWIL